MHPLVQKTAALPAETVEFQASVSVSAEADGWDGFWVWDTGESEAWVFDSVAGVDLHANCGPSQANPMETCTGFKYILASWY